MLTEIFEKSLVSFKRIPRGDADEFVKKHYLGKHPAASKYYIGLFYRKALRGVVVYGSPMPSVAKSLFRNDLVIRPADILELKRMYIAEEMPADERKGLASYAIIGANHLAGKLHDNLKLVVSFSDPSTHEGTIYRASNGIYMGRGSGASGKDKYVYPQGSKTTKRVIRNNLKTPH
ncbi:MAG: Mom family adenine methylcarbamoylation protein [Candidatus Ranarchaeia archaeon]|jgi:hypothetical protein